MIILNRICHTRIIDVIAACTPSVSRLNWKLATAMIATACYLTVQQAAAQEVEFADPVENPFAIDIGEWPTLFWNATNAVDVDLDGDIDLLGIEYILYGYCVESAGFFYAENTGTATDPSFTGHQICPLSLPGNACELSSLPLNAYSNMNSGDFDMDGDVDVVLSVEFGSCGGYSGQYSQPGMIYLKNSGSPQAHDWEFGYANLVGSFVESVSAPFIFDHALSSPAGLMDLNANGHPDYIGAVAYPDETGLYTYQFRIGVADLVPSDPYLLDLDSIPDTILYMGMFSLLDSLESSVFLKGTISDLDSIRSDSLWIFGMHDTDNDSLPEILAFSEASFRYPDFDTLRIYKFANLSEPDGNIRFESPVLYAEIPWISGEFLYQPIFADLDGDSDPDLIIGSDSGKYYYLENLDIQSPPTTVQQFESLRISLWPNPAGDVVRFNCGLPDDTPVRCFLYDTAGRILRDEVFHHENMRLDVHELPEGIYWLVALSNYGQGQASVFVRH